MSLISQTIGIIERYGVLEFYLPFVLTFSIFYALLEKSKVFGTVKTQQGEVPNHTINAIVAVVAAFYVIAYTPVGFKMSEFLASFFTQTMTTLVGLMGIGMILALGMGIGWKPTCWVGKFTIVLILLAIGMIIFFSSGGLKVFGLSRVSTIGGLSVDDIFFLGLIGLTILIIMLVAGWTPKPCEKERPEQQGGGGG